MGGRYKFEFLYYVLPQHSFSFHETILLLTANINDGRP